MPDGLFEYSPSALPDYVHAVTQASSQLEDVRGQAQNVLNGIQEFFTSQGGDAFTQAQMTINDGINSGQEVIRRHASVVDTAHQDMIGTDAAAAQSFGF
ncbi:hypothetical protein LV457_12220 [Mycobacterium sp. MYCO198283]|uniref:WXG100 family type VII secretion target n=1 Tax=Mycobacterium sp. MYCO198283 TaxID=2883505 RepID=UPI001E62AA7B|nr:hypothetical protein [Mycobacterium sp. MYCO198283]MCG5433047.1 hypothetical protein [Mycobacterium sp. MYCO198283]